MGNRWWQRMCQDVVRWFVTTPTGCWFHQRIQPRLRKAIGFLLDHPAQHAAMGVAAREILVQEYPVPKVAGQMLDLYRELLGQNWEGRSSHRNA